MNKVTLVGRLTRDPDVRYSAGEQSMAIARYTLVVDRRGKKRRTADSGFHQLRRIRKNRRERRKVSGERSSGSGFRSDPDRFIHE